MKNIYTLISYKGSGECVGSFTSVKKCIEFLKNTVSKNIGYVTTNSMPMYENKYLGVSLLKRSEHEYLYYFLDLNEPTNEQTTYKVWIGELNWKKEN